MLEELEDYTFLEFLTPKDHPNSFSLSSVLGPILQDHILKTVFLSLVSQICYYRVGVLFLTPTIQEALGSIPSTA